MTWFEWVEALSYIVTIFGLPLAIVVFIYEQRRERKNEEEELYQRLSDEYTTFLKLVLANPDLQLLRKSMPTEPPTDEQYERKLAIFSILVSLFERAYILVYEPKWIGKRSACGSPGRTTCASGAGGKTFGTPCRIY
jgi:hypothetical protein